jgi:hypothetical protein
VALGLQHEFPAMGISMHLEFLVPTFNTEQYSYLPLIFKRNNVMHSSRLAIQIL